MPSLTSESEDRVQVLGVTQVADTGFSVLRQTEFHYRRGDGTSTRLRRETYDHGNGAAILLFDPARECILLVQQFRYPAYANPTADQLAGGRRGWLIEVPAGLIDDHGHSGRTAEAAIVAEAEEEAGVRVTDPRRILETYSSPGSVTERVALFIAAYDVRSRVGPGSGLASEGEDIVVLEVTLDEAQRMVERGEITDSKTIILLFWAKLNLAEMRSLGTAGNATPNPHPG